MFRIFLSVLICLLIHKTLLADGNSDNVNPLTSSSSNSNTEKLNFLQLQIEKYEQNKPDSALLFLNELLTLINKNDTSENYWLNKKSSLLINLQAYEEAGKTLNFIADKLNDKDKNEVIDFLLNKGSLALHLQQLDSAYRLDGDKIIKVLEESPVSLEHRGAELVQSLSKDDNSDY